MEDKGPWLPIMQASLKKGKTILNGGETAPGNGADETGARAPGYQKPELAVPIKSADELLGVFGFAGHEDDYWAEEEISAVEAVVEQVGLALEKQRLYEQTQKAAAELAVLNEMARKLAAALSINQIIAITYQYIKRLLHTTETYIALYDAETDEVDVRILGEEEEIVESALRRRGGKGITELIIRNGEPLLLPVVTPETPQEYGYEVFGRMAKSWLGVPMLIGQRRLGVIAVQDFEQTYRFNRHDQDVLTAIAGQAAISIQNANLFNETATLYQAIAALNAARSYQEVLEVLDQFSTLGQESTIMVYHRFDRPWTQSQNPEWYDIPARLAKVDTLPLAPRFRFSDSPAAMQLRPDRPVWVEDIATDPRLDETTRANLTGRTQMKSVIFVPLVYGGQWTGNLAAFYKEPHPFPEEAIHQFTGLCRQAAIAIQNLRLVEEAQQRAHREELLRRVTAQVRNATEVPAITHIATQELAQYLHRPVQVHLDMDTRQGNGHRAAGPSAENDQRPVTTAWLLSRGARIGQILIEDEPDNPLTDDELSLIQAVARQVSAALENLYLLEETRKRAVELETVSRVGTATSTILESQRLLQAVVNLTKQSFDLYHVQIFLLESEQTQLRLVAGAGEIGARMKSENWRVNLDQEGLLAQVVRSGAGKFVHDICQEPHYQPNPLLPATRAELAVPMIAGNTLLGVFDVHADRPGLFSDADIVIQNALATQVAVALQNAMLYEEQIQTAKKLREVERLKSEFLASMSHELRTPLNSILGFADVLLEGLDGELNPRMREDVQLIRDSGQYLRELIGDILDMSKIEAGKMRLRYELIAVPELAEEILANARTIATGFKKDHLAITTAVKPEVTTIYADRTRLKQIIYNLLSNAIKFTETGEIRLAMGYEDDWFRVSVTDTGIGIKKDNLPLIFEQFRQVDNTLTGITGTGLGLPISKSLIELHGGRLNVESVVGRGTKFWFQIPRYGTGNQVPETGT